jgi:hypothetical protein
MGEFFLSYFTYLLKAFSSSDMSSSPSDPLGNTFTPAGRLYSAASFSSSPLPVQHQVLTSEADPFLETPDLQKPNTPVCVPGPSGRSRVGLGVAMSTIMSREEDNDWRDNIDKPLFDLVDFLRRNCVVCFLERDDEYQYHRVENCSKKSLPKTDNAYYQFRMELNFPVKMCYGCGLHTGVSLFYDFSFHSIKIISRLFHPMVLTLPTTAPTKVYSNPYFTTFSKTLKC